MSEEGHHFDRKSLRKITGKTADFHELAYDCVCFANGAGGELLVGLEDGEAHPPPDQRIDRALLDQVRKRVAELTVNVEVLLARASSPISECCSSAQPPIVRDSGRLRSSRPFATTSAESR